MKKMNSKWVRLILVSTSIAFSAASKALVEKDCQKNLTQATASFITKNAKLLTGHPSQSIKYKILNMKNTTPGSYDQLYEVDVVLEWPSKHPDYPFGQDLKLKFFSPFICDRLQLRGFE